jgi:hypothetical protein
MPFSTKGGAEARARAASSVVNTSNAGADGADGAGGAGEGAEGAAAQESPSLTMWQLTFPLEEAEAQALSKGPRKELLARYAPCVCPLPCT